MLSACWLQQGEALLAEALANDPNNSLLRLLIAQYVRSFRGNVHVEQLHLASAAVNCS